jgi:anti-sigma-K factor RskA
MNEHAWYQSHLDDYASGTLDPRDAGLVAAHLEQCPACRQAVAHAEQDLRYLPMAAAPVPPSPGFRDRTLRAALGTPQARQGLAPAWGWALAASAVLATTVAVQARQTIARLDAQLADRAAHVDSLTSALAMARDTLAVLGPASTVRYAALTMPQSTGGLLVFEDTVAHRWHLVAHGLPALPAGQRYQLWYLCEDGMAEGTMLPMSPDGVARVTVGMPENPPGRVVGAAITVETIGGGTPPAGHGPKVATLML